MKNKKGFTVAEMAMVAAVLGIVYAMTEIGIRIINDFARQRALITAQEQIQTVLYGVVREVRNCRAIVHTSSTTLILNTFNFKKYNFTNPSLFDPVQTGTITYQYTAEAGKTFLKRTEEFPGEGRGDRFLLTNLLLPPTLSDGIFKGLPSGCTSYCQSAEIIFRLKIPLTKDTTYTFRAESMKRTTL
ncbi:MAG: type II secretion system protein [Elusimicrobiota bacterium]